MIPKLIRHPNNPILSPSQNWWEKLAVFNPGAILYKDKIVLLYRAVGEDNISRLGFAESLDGINFTRFNEPRYDPPIDDPYERIGAEDPRITLLDGKYYILYTAASLYEANKDYKTVSVSSRAPFRIRIGIATTQDFKTINHEMHIFDNVDSKDAVFFPEKIDRKYILLHRVYPNLSLSASEDFQHWSFQNIASPRPNFWDSQKIGAGSVPIAKPYGWLLFYHGVDNHNCYHIGIMVLDRKNPEKVLYRSPAPTFSPETEYEKTGRVDNVVFTCGVVIFKGQYFVYYGAADKVIGLATFDENELDNFLIREVNG